MQNKLLLKYTITGIVFVSLAGTLNHFVYDWSGQNKIIGLFTAVNESTWEHMKLLFFPMLVYSIFICSKLKHRHPSAIPSILMATLTGTFLIPVIFYTYTGILGYMITAINLATFYVSVIASFIVFYRTSTRHDLSKLNLLLYFLVTLFICMFFLFTYDPPELGIFIDPTM